MEASGRIFYRILAGSIRDIEFGVIENLPLHEPVLCRRLDAGPRIFKSVHVTDFIAIISRNRNFADGETGRRKLDDNVRIKIKICTIGLEGNLFERGDSVRAVATVQFTEAGANEAILHVSQNTIPDEFIERHAAPQCPPGG